MAEISVNQVKSLRERTGAGMMACRKALDEAGGDEEQAALLLRQRGAAQAEKRAGRATKEGAVGTYLHHNNRVGVLVELNCETDFVARNELFQELLRKLCLQVAAMNPVALSREEVPAEFLEREKSVVREQMKGKPEHILDKIVQGKMEKIYQEICLLEQPFIQDQERTIQDLVKDAIGVLKENIQVGRFVRFEVGSE